MESASRHVLQVPSQLGHDPLDARIGVRLRDTQAQGVEAARLAKAMRKPPHPATTEKEYTDEEMEVLTAIQTFQVKFARKFLAHSEILGVLKGMGYVRVPHGYKIVPCHDARAEPETTAPQPHVRLFLPEE